MHVIQQFTLMADVVYFNINNSFKQLVLRKIQKKQFQFISNLDSKFVLQLQ
jgi:hypothetical protein